MKKKYKVMRVFAVLLLFLVIPIVIGGCSKKQAKNPNEIVVDTELTEKIKKDKGVSKANVYTQNGNVLATIVVKNELKDEDAKKLANEYAEQIKAKYKDKVIDVQIIKNGNNIVNVVKNEDLKPKTTAQSVKNDASMPKFTVKIENGLTVTNRYVAVTLETSTPEKYKVTVLGKELKYVADKKVFHEVIESTDEQAIKGAVKIEAKK